MIDWFGRVNVLTCLCFWGERCCVWFVFDSCCPSVHLTVVLVDRYSL